MQHQTQAPEVRATTGPMRRVRQNNSSRLASDAVIKRLETLVEKQGTMLLKMQERLDQVEASTSTYNTNSSNSESRAVKLNLSANDNNALLVNIQYQHALKKY